MLDDELAKKRQTSAKRFQDVSRDLPLLVTQPIETQALDVDVLTALRWVAIATVSLLAVIFPLLAQRLTLLKAPATAEELVDLARRLDLFHELSLHRFHRYQSQKAVNIDNRWTITNSFWISFLQHLPHEADLFLLTPHLLSIPLLLTHNFEARCGSWYPKVQSETRNYEKLLFYRAG